MLIRLEIEELESIVCGLDELICSYADDVYRSKEEIEYIELLKKLKEKLEKEIEYYNS